MTDSQNSESTHRRIVALEQSEAVLRHALFGNGEAGLDERIRNLEAWKKHQALHQTKVEEFMRVSIQNTDRLTGGWTVVKWAMGLGLPALGAALYRVIVLLESMQGAQ